jgi:HAMP domain-containing protein
MKIAHKFLLVSAAVSIPIAVLSYFFIGDKVRLIEFTQAELDGTEYLRHVRKLAVDVAAHRDLAIAVLVGDETHKPELERRRLLVDEDLKGLGEVQKRLEFAAPADVQGLNNDWMTIKGWLAGATPVEVFDMHGRYLAKLLQFGALIANESNLVFDSDVESHYIIDALVFKVPRLDAALSAARAKGSVFSARLAQGDRAADLRAELAETAVKINDALAETNHTIRFAVGATHPFTEQALRPAIAAINRGVPAFQLILVDKVVNGSQPMPLKDYFASVAEPLDATAKLWDSGVEELDRLLGEREQMLQRTIYIELGAVGAAMLLTIGFLFLIARAILRPIKHLSEVADRISLGDMDALIKVDTRDEIGELGERFRRMQVSLKSAMDALETRDG